MKRNRMLKILVTLLVTVAVTILFCIPAFAAVDVPPPGGGPGAVDPNINIAINGGESDAVKIVLLLTVLTVLPSIILMMTCFTRVVIVFSLLRNALGLQQTPPNQVLVGLALFLSLFIMYPVLGDIAVNAYQPYAAGDIESSEFLQRASDPLKEWMLAQAKPEDINMFLNISNSERPENLSDLSLVVVIPAFITSELKRAFIIGFLLFLPFLIVDVVVASALMSMGMMMMPPATVALPFKILLFIMVDGWGLVIRALVGTYQ